jgi:hypothetical protein
VTLSFETFLPFEISFQLKIHTLILKPCKRIANIHVHTSVDLHTDANVVHVIRALERYNQLRKQRSDLKHFLPGIIM